MNRLGSQRRRGVPLIKGISSRRQVRHSCKALRASSTLARLTHFRQRISNEALRQKSLELPPGSRVSNHECLVWLGAAGTVLHPRVEPFPTHHNHSTFLREYSTHSGHSGEDSQTEAHWSVNHLRRRKIKAPESHGRRASHHLRLSQNASIFFLLFSRFGALYCG